MNHGIMFDNQLQNPFGYKPNDELLHKWYEQTQSTAWLLFSLALQFW